MTEEYKIFIPGRLCLFGEHSDWASSFATDKKGIAIVSTIGEGIEATVSRNDKFIFIFNNRLIELDLDKLDSYQDKFFSYVIETYKILREEYLIGGIKIVINNMDLPIGKGLASSAAVCLLVTEAICKAYKVDLTVDKKIDISYRGERRTGSLCGKLDFISAYGKGIYVINFNDGEIDNINKIENNCNINMIFSEIKKKDTKKILSILHDNYNNISEYFVKDIGICNKAIDAISNNDIVLLGKLMLESQDNYNEIISPLDKILCEDDLVNIYMSISKRKKILGYKGIGSHGGGAIQFLLKDSETQDYIFIKLKQLKYNSYKITI
ncbi:MAG: hypothetical protein PHQ64_04085 [Bacilli bacterium]|nr:hypothetical protein [Bacilli bacterium]